MGDVVAAPYNPFTSLFIQDPLFRYSLYLLPHLTLSEKRKLDRVYYPRTAKILVDSYDVIIFRDARVDHFTPKQFEGLDYAFREGGMASVTAHSLSWPYAWYPTILYDLSPIAGYDFRFLGRWSVRFRKEREPVFLPFVDLGIEKASGLEYGTMDVKQGATIWADMIPNNRAWLVSWKPSGGNPGVQWVFADKFDLSWWGLSLSSRGSNPYAMDFATNLILYSLQRPLIEDIISRREARELLSTFRTRQLLLLSVLDWIEKFGANTLPLSRQVAEIEKEAGNAIEHYLDQDYTGTISFMEELDPRIWEISAEAERMKNQAMFWVYVSEWLSVTAASLVTGTLLWTLMVRRRMYKQVGETRLSPR